MRVAFLRLAHDWGVLQPLSVREWLWRAIRARGSTRPSCPPTWPCALVGRRINALLDRLPWTRWGGWLAPLLLVAGAVLCAAAVSSPNI